MAHAAVTARAVAYDAVHFKIRTRLFTGLCNGTMDLGSIVEDDRLKMLLPQSCSYCGVAEQLAVDHLLPTKRGGPDSGDNIVWACRACNSSKGYTDLLVWLARHNRFPPLLLLHRYLKVAIEWSRRNKMMESESSSALECDLPFAVAALRRKFPPPTTLCLWVSGLTDREW